MQTFHEHYYLQEKFLSDIRRSLTSNIMKHRKTGVDVGKGQFKNIVSVDSPQFDRIKENIRREVVKVFEIEKQNKKGKKSPKQRIKDEIGKLHVSNVLEGDIDSGKDKLEGEPIATIVYELSNNGKIAFITTEDDEGYIRRYIATSSKGNDFFRKNIGTTLQQIAADAKKSKKLVTKDSAVNPYTEIQQLVHQLSYDEKPLKIPGMTSNEHGLIDISYDDFLNLRSMWGNGKIRAGRHSIFTNKFVRRPYSNSKTEYAGYKYLDTDGDNVVYLMDTGDGRNAFIAFNDKDSYEWSKKLGMLSFWKTRPGKLSIDWRNGKFEDME